MVEVHPEPESARSDSDQQLTAGELADLAERVRRVARAIDRTLPVRVADRDPSGGTVQELDPVVHRLREQISDNDRRLVEAVNTRLELVRRMRHHKESRGIALDDRDREQRLLRYLEETNRGPLSREGLEEIFHTLLELTKREAAADGSESVAS
jgi:chorismate mutase